MYILCFSYSYVHFDLSSNMIAMELRLPFSFSFFFWERLYPSSSFWKTFFGRQKEFVRTSSSSNSPGGLYLHLLHSHLFDNLIIECGEIDGVVLGSWTNVNLGSSVPVVDEDNAHAGYWAAAGIWSNTWDQRTIDRVSYFLFLSSSNITVERYSIT
jgi:hypothetical protein